MYKYPIIIKKAKGNYSAYCPDLPGCVATGKTVKETLARAKKAIRFHLEGMKKEGLPIPAPTSRVEYIQISVSI